MTTRRIPKSSGRELAPEGVHNAVLVQFIDLGTQPSNNPDWEAKRQCQLAFELVDEKTKDGRAIVEYKQYTYSDSTKGNFMKDLKAWLGIKDGNFDMDEALGKPANITVQHKVTEKGTFANITNISAVPAKDAKRVRKPTEPLRSLYLDEAFDEETFAALPQHIQNKIATSPEYVEVQAPRQKKVVKKK